MRGGQVVRRRGRVDQIHAKALRPVRARGVAGMGEGKVWPKHSDGELL